MATLHTLVADSKRRDNRNDIRNAFGGQAKLPAIDENITRMKKGTMKINSASPSSRLEDAHAAAQGIPGPGGGHTIVNNRAQYSELLIGPGFHGLSKEDQSGTLIHELSHYTAGTTDAVLVDPTPGAAVPFFIDQPNHGLPNAVKMPGEACKLSTDITRSCYKQTTYILHRLQMQRAGTENLCCIRISSREGSQVRM